MDYYKLFNAHAVLCRPAAVAGPVTHVLPYAHHIRGTGANVFACMTVFKPVRVP